MFIFILATIVFASCGKKKHEAVSTDDLIRPASMTYTSQDTAEIKYLVDTYVGYLDKGNLDACAAMLYTFDNDKVTPYSEARRDSFKQGLSHFNIYGTRVKGMMLRSDRNNQVDVAVQIIRNGNLLKGTGVTTLSLNPVLVNGKWYLTLLDKDADGVKDVYEEQLENERRL